MTKLWFRFALLPVVVDLGRLGREISPIKCTGSMIWVNQTPNISSSFLFFYIFNVHFHWSEWQNAHTRHFDGEWMNCLSATFDWGWFHFFVTSWVSVRKVEQVVCRTPGPKRPVFWFLIHQEVGWWWWVGFGVNQSRRLSAPSCGAGSQSNVSRLMEKANEMIPFEFALERQNKRIDEGDSLAGSDALVRRHICTAAIWI